MGRTLHYKVYDEPKNYREAEREIRIARELLIDRFTWTCEWPSLRHLDEGDRLRRADETVLKQKPPVPIAEGFTKVADDEWNAVLITRYVTWLSRRLPTATVTLRDEGDYLSPGRQILRRGKPELDYDELLDRAQRFVDAGQHEALRVLREKVEAFKRGEIHRSIPAREYADRREIQALGFTPETLARMTLDEDADAVAFPWATEGLGAA